MLSTNQSSCSVLSDSFEQGVRGDIRHTIPAFNPGYLAASIAGSMTLKKKGSLPSWLHTRATSGMTHLDQGCVSISLKVLLPFLPPASTS